MPVPTDSQRRYSEGATRPIRTDLVTAAMTGAVLEKASETSVAPGEGRMGSAALALALLSAGKSLIKYRDTCYHPSKVSFHGGLEWSADMIKQSCWWT